MVNGGGVGVAATHRQSTGGHASIVLGVLCRLATHNPVGSVTGSIGTSFARLHAPNGEWWRGGRGCNASPINWWPCKHSTGCALSAGYSQSGWECDWINWYQLCPFARTKW